MTLSGRVVAGTFSGTCECANGANAATARNHSTLRVSPPLAVALGNFGQLSRETVIKLPFLSWFASKHGPTDTLLDSLSSRKQDYPSVEVGATTRTNNLLRTKWEGLGVRRASGSWRETALEFTRLAW